MGDYPYQDPYRSSGADLPKPRKKPEPASPKTPPSAQKPTSGKQPSPKQPTYGSDTMQLRLPPEEVTEDYDASFEQRRAAQKPRTPQSQPPRQPSRKQPAPAKKQPAPQAKPKKKRRKSTFLTRFLRNLAILAAAIFIIYSAAALFLIGRLEKVSPGPRTVTSGTLEAGYVTNILLIGTDARDAAAERGRSDSMILLSINSSAQQIYLTSFMRDAYVEIPGHGGAKLNAAYSLGGAELLMDTLEANYDISIDDYMSVSFTGFAGIIDAFGGVELTLSPEEAQAVNDILLSEVNELMGDARDADFLQGGGTFVLNGKQALSYARIRYVGNADFERTSRQREVMTQLFSKVKTNLVTAVPELVSSAMPHIATNMSTGEMYGLSLRVPFAAGYSISQIQIPADGTWSNDTVNGQSVLRVNFAENTRILQETVYASTAPATAE